jgi:hypothetical protein
LLLAFRAGATASLILVGDTEFRNFRHYEQSRQANARTVREE